MNQNVQNVPGFSGGGVIVAERNRVLRNTYWLLALSMVPTVLGAWVGMAMGLNRILTPGIGAIVFLAGAFGFMFAIEKLKNSAAGVPVLLGFTFFMGMMLSRMLALLVSVIFSFFIMYDLKRVRDGEETNYISATLGVYLSIYNVFQSLLMLFGIGGGSND